MVAHPAPGEIDAERKGETGPKRAGFCLIPENGIEF